MPGFWNKLLNRGQTSMAVAAAPLRIRNAQAGIKNSQQQLKSPQEKVEAWLAQTNAASPNPPTRGLVAPPPQPSGHGPAQQGLLQVQARQPGASTPPHVPARQAKTSRSRAPKAMLGRGAELKTVSDAAVETVHKRLRVWVTQGAPREQSPGVLEMIQTTTAFARARLKQAPEPEKRRLERAIPDLERKARYVRDIQESSSPEEAARGARRFSRYLNPPAASSPNVPGGARRSPVVVAPAPTLAAGHTERPTGANAPRALSPDSPSRSVLPAAPRPESAREAPLAHQLSSTSTFQISESDIAGARPLPASGPEAPSERAAATPAAALPRAPASPVPSIEARPPTEAASLAHCREVLSETTGALHRALSQNGNPMQRLEAIETFVVVSKSILAQLQRSPGLVSAENLKSFEAHVLYGESAAMLARGVRTQPQRHQGLWEGFLIRAATLQSLL